VIANKGVGSKKRIKNNIIRAPSVLMFEIFSPKNGRKKLPVVLLKLQFKQNKMIKTLVFKNIAIFSRKIAVNPRKL
jgi:hypothetical protein